MGGRWQPITFAEYGEAVRACPDGLIRLGLAPGDFGAVMTTDRPEWHEADFELIDAGLVSSPVYPASAPTWKIRRGPIVERYADEIARLYA